MAGDVAGDWQMRLVSTWLVIDQMSQVSNIALADLAADLTGDLAADVAGGREDEPSLQRRAG